MPKIFKSFITMSIAAISLPTFASDFSLPFINAAGLGTAYADWATSADDATVAYSNPAALTKFHHQQVVFAPLFLTGSTKFTGTTKTPPYPLPPFGTLSGSASSRLWGIFPNLAYAVPINDRFVFGISETTPFALGTNYSKDSIVRYTATRSKIVVVDLSPSVGYKVSDQLSLGLGLDVNRLAFTLNSMFGPPISVPDSESQNNLYAWGYGWHAGILYQALSCTRIGLSFNSMTMFHSTGNSQVFSPFGAFRTTNQKSNAALPARTQLSIHQDIDPRWAVMGTVFYTNWSTLDKITLKRVILPGGATIPVTIPLNYHNTFDYSLGATYKATDKWLLRAGAQYMNTPSNNRNRGVADPVGSATILALGAHYQQNPCFGYDVGVAHSFFQQMPVNLVTPVTSATGHNNTQSTVFGGQVTWNII